jgi:hypothetical protein
MHQRTADLRGHQLRSLKHTGGMRTEPYQQDAHRPLRQRMLDQVTDVKANALADVDLHRWEGGLDARSHAIAG